MKEPPIRKTKIPYMGGVKKNFKLILFCPFSCPALEHFLPMLEITLLKVILADATCVPRIYPPSLKFEELIYN